MKIFFSLLLVILASTERCDADITSSPGLQRLNIGDTCIFRWTISDSSVSMQISNQTSGSALRQGANSVYDANNKVITLTITNIQLWDAGNYSLVINGQTSSAEFSACLFVYGTSWASVYLSSSSATTLTEGDSVELTCNITSTSLPAAYQPKMFTSWYITGFGNLQNVSSGPAMRYNSDVVPGHSIKNDGRTLVIDSIKYPDDSYFQCWGLEDGSRASSSYTSFTLSMRYRPYISGSLPSSRRLTTIPVTDVYFTFNFQAVPTTTSMTNWSFTDTAGNRRNLPANSLAYCAPYFYNYCSLDFNLTSDAYYGKYWMTLTNDVNSTTAEFLVLRPGPPDTPSNLQLFYISHSAISVNLKVMFANSVDYIQTIYVRLISQDTGIEIETQNNNFSNVYNYSTNTVFQKNIQPKSNYEVRVWSTNVKGPSGVVSLFVKTRSQPKLNVSQDTISINGSQAIVNFTLVGDDQENVTYVYATCCSVLTGGCAYSSFRGKPTIKQIVINNIPNGTDYLFDLTVNCGIYQRYEYYSTIAKGIKASRNGTYPIEAGCQEANNKSLLIAVIVLAVLLGVAVLALIGTVIACLCMKSRTKNETYEMPTRPPNDVNDKPKAGTDARPVSAGNDDVYEVLESEARYDNR